MDLIAFMKKYAEEIGGQFSNYDSTHSIIVVPLAGGRYQSVVGAIKTNDLYNRNLVTFISKVCAYDSGIALKELLEQSAHFNYCRFVIDDNFLQVEAVAAMSTASEEMTKEMIQEVANLADQFEFKLTGADIF